MKNHIIHSLAVVTLLSMFSCNTKEDGNVVMQVQTPPSEFLVQSVLWYQHAAEMEALYFQAYNIARLRLDQQLAASKSDKKKAVVVDIDETILDNSPFEGWCILNDSTYSKENWNTWVNKKSADTLPGALGFLRYANSKGVEVFYISNRLTVEVSPTLKNLEKFGFPNADEAHAMFKTDNSSKEIRRNLVLEDYDILLLCGDNLGDFSAAFDHRTAETIGDSVKKFSNEFGNRFIVLPNPMYGDWEKLIYGKNANTPATRDSARCSKVIGY
ncbi:MAG: 5'-nucleotidase, lipoprotein e(P4) family [Bacteroidetes bacterium]|nr:5'-nucleotidase, lipoprotein e(P4) family [Bacteroidota bacterium]MBU1719544.1 5'-nucleotidase, lipoprotein e(P4) family [Bacteroidota bacterium]